MSEAAGRRSCWTAAAGLALAVSSAVLAACGEPPRRVVLVSIDTLRADHVGCYGADWARTPTLDGLAAQGVRFDRAIAPAPVTLPSHASLLTGLDPPQHGVRGNGTFRLAPEVPILSEHLRERGFATAAFVGSLILGERFGLARGFDVYDDDVERRLPSASAIVTPNERPADEVVDAALGWLAQAPDRFLLWVHFYDPHWDYAPPPGFLAAFPGRLYDGEIAFADRELGRLVSFVDRRFGDGRTLVVVTSDHGEALGEHGEATHSLLVYDSTQRVPLVMRGPGLPPGRVVEPVVALRDVAPTITDLLEVSPLPGATGRSLVPAIRGRGFEEIAAYVEAIGPQLEWGLSPLLGLRSADWKYVRAPRPELYDLREDPRERRNRAPAEPERVAALDAELERRLGGGRADARLPVSGAERERIAALGYLVADPSPRGDAALGQVGGLDPKDAMPIVNAVFRANDALGRGRPSDALAMLEGLEADLFPLHFVRARAALRAGAFARAERAARAAVRGDPRRTAGHELLAEILAARGRFEEAARAQAEGLAIDPASGEALAQLGELRERAGAIDDAMTHYRRALEAARPDPSASWRLAALLLERGAPERAAALLAGADAREIASPRAALRLARAEESAGLPEAAMRRLEDAARAHADAGRFDLLLALAELRLRAGVAAEEGGALTAALAELEAGLPRADPGTAPGLELARARALRAVGRDEEARRALAAALAEVGRLSARDRADAGRLADRLGVPGPPEVR